MSKAIKQMQMDSLKTVFNGVRDMVFINIRGLPSMTENQIRLDLRKKGIRLHQVKNTLARRVFGEMGLTAEGGWKDSTTIAWGANSVKELSKEIQDIAKKHDKFIKVKTAMVDGQEIAFAQALKMPTRLEAIGEVIGMVVGVASTLASMLTGPASQIASQIQQISEKKEEGKEEGKERRPPRRRPVEVSIGTLAIQSGVGAPEPVKLSERTVTKRSYYA